MTNRTLHLMTQRDQPYGSERRCCERCGLMMVWRPESFWNEHAYVCYEADFRGDLEGLTPCDKQYHPPSP